MSDPAGTTDVPLVDTSRRVVRRPTPDEAPVWVGHIPIDMAISRSGLIDDEEIWVTPEVLDVAYESHLNGVDILVSLDEASPYEPSEDMRQRLIADRSRTYSHTFQIEGSYVSVSPTDTGAFLAPFLFRVTYSPDEPLDPGNIDNLAKDSALTAVTAGAHAWLIELWRWAGVVGARRIQPRRQHHYRALAEIIRPNGDAYQVMPYPHRTTVVETQDLVSRVATPLTPDTYVEILDLVDAGTPAPAAPLLVGDAVDVAVAGDLRSAMVLAGTALDLVLDETWAEAKAVDTSLPELSGTLGKKAARFEDNSIALPLGLTRAALQSDVIKVRNDAAHGDALVSAEVWDALGIMVDIARERWPEGPPSTWMRTVAP